MAELRESIGQEPPARRCRDVVYRLRSQLPNNALSYVPRISPEQIKRVLNEMTPERCFITRLQRNFKENADKNPEQWKTEVNTGCLYQAEPFSGDMLKAWSTSDPETEKLFDWPKPNPFIPKDLTIKSRAPNLPELSIVSAPDRNGAHRIE